MGTVFRIAFLVVLAAAAWTFRARFGDVGGALATAGWTGLAAVTVYHLMPLALCGAAWGSLLPDSRLAVFVLCRWIRDGVSELAGFLPLAGEMAGARALNRSGIRPATAGALTVVDVTAEVLSQFLFSLLGVSLWLARHPSSEVVTWALAGVGISVPVLLAFVVVQRSKAMRFLETLPARLAPKLWRAPDAANGVHATITALWADHRRVGGAVALHLVAWIVSTGEAWIALVLLGLPLSIWDVLALESVVFAIRSAAFFVPAALGVQEGGYIILGGLLGLPPEVALAVSLLKRGRSLILGLPALGAWHLLERRQRS
jgi:putative membrane protein